MILELSGNPWSCTQALRRVSAQFGYLPATFRYLFVASVSHAIDLLADRYKSNLQLLAVVIAQLHDLGT
jgi:hypothetical protein